MRMSGSRLVVWSQNPLMSDDWGCRKLFCLTAFPNHSAQDTWVKALWCRHTTSGMQEVGYSYGLCTCAMRSVFSVFGPPVHLVVMSKLFFFESSGVCWAARASSKAEQRQIMNHEWSWLESPEIHQVASRYQGLWHIMGAMEVWSGMVRYGPVWPGMVQWEVSSPHCEWQVAASWWKSWRSMRAPSPSTIAAAKIMVRSLRLRSRVDGVWMRNHGAIHQGKGGSLSNWVRRVKGWVFHATPAMISIILYQVSVSKELTANHSKFRLQLLTEVHSNLAVESLSSCQWRKWHRMILTVTCTNLTDFLWQLCILILIPGRWLVTTSRCSLA